MQINSKVSQQYDRLAQIYDRRWHSYVTNSLTCLRNYLKATEITTAATLLDIGCGTGELERSLIADYPDLKAIGVDISANMLEVARLKLAGYPNVEFHQTEAIALPFGDRSFDLVITASAFHYFDRAIDSLKEINRVLKPSGSLIVMDWCRDFWYCKLLNQFLKLTDPAHTTCYTQRELAEMLEQTSFIVQDSQKFRLPPLWGMMIVKVVKVESPLI
jgi:ubiquinone/menaquinone biosynthesis C-methylase UbiE